MAVEVDDPIFRASGKYSGGDRDVLGVVAVGLVEGGEFADGTVDLVGLVGVGVVGESDVDLRRLCGFLWEVGRVAGAEDGLAAEDQDVSIASDA